jgi:hypothetical protein
MGMRGRMKKRRKGRDDRLDRSRCDNREALRILGK